MSHCPPLLPSSYFKPCVYLSTDETKLSYELFISVALPARTNLVLENEAVQNVHGGLIYTVVNDPSACNEPWLFQDVRTYQLPDTNNLEDRQVGVQIAQGDDRKTVIVHHADADEPGTGGPQG